LCIFKNHYTGEGMKFGQLILRRIVKIVAAKCQILRLKCTKIDFSAPSDPLAGFQGPPKGRGYKKGGEGTPVCIFKFYLVK